MLPLAALSPGILSGLTRLPGGPRLISGSLRVIRAVDRLWRLIPGFTISDVGAIHTTPAFLVALDPQRDDCIFP